MSFALLAVSFVLSVFSSNALGGSIEERKLFLDSSGRPTFYIEPIDAADNGGHAGYKLLGATQKLVIVDTDTQRIAIQFRDAEGRRQPVPADAGSSNITLTLLPENRAVFFSQDGIAVKHEAETDVLLDASGAAVALGLDKPLFVQVRTGSAPVVDVPVVDVPVVDVPVVDVPLAPTPLPDRSKESLETSDSRNIWMERMLASDAAAAWIKALHLEIKSFERDDGSAALGLSYDFARHLTDVPEATGTTYAGWMLDLTSRGNIAFDPDVNPSDFVDLRLTYKYFCSSGGMKNVPDEDASIGIYRTQLTQRMAVESARTKKNWSTIQHDDPAYAGMTSELRSWFTPQTHFDIGLQGAFEANQDFSATHFNVGIQGVLDYKVWDSGDNRAKLNFFDLPFAVVRLITGYDDQWRVRGSTFPTLVAAFEHVEPDGNDPRAAAGDTSSFERWRVEAAFRTPIAFIDGKQYFFSADYRYHHEVAAGGSVDAAGFDDIEYIALSVSSEAGLFVSYRSGKLPFDVDDAESFEVGWKLNF